MFYLQDNSTTTYRYLYHDRFPSGTNQSRIHKKTATQYVTKNGVRLTGAVYFSHTSHRRGDWLLELQNHGGCWGSS